MQIKKNYATGIPIETMTTHNILSAIPITTAFAINTHAITTCVAETSVPIAAPHSQCLENSAQTASENTVPVATQLPQNSPFVATQLSVSPQDETGQLALSTASNHSEDSFYNEETLHNRTLDNIQDCCYILLFSPTTATFCIAQPALAYLSNRNHIFAYIAAVYNTMTFLLAVSPIKIPQLPAKNALKRVKLMLVLPYLTAAVYSWLYVIDNNDYNRTVNFDISIITNTATFLLASFIICTASF